MSHTHISSVAVATTTWLTRLNAWRANAGLPALTENPTWSAGDSAHALYMVKNDLITHYETAGVPYYTAAGDTAARNSNIQVSSTTSSTDQNAIDWWMGAPFHALGMMDPRLTQTGFGSYREVKSGWQEGAALDTLHGNPFTGGTYPVYWPGNGKAEPLTTYSGGEFPDPLQACSGYAVPTGLPVFLEVGGNVATTVGPVHTFTGNGSALAHCVIDSNSPSVGSNLTSRGGVIVIPRQPLQAGVNYAVTLTVNSVPYTWSFSVGPLASGPPAPTAVTATAAGTSATVTWTPPTSDGGSAITGYTVTPYAGSIPQTSQTVAAPTATAVFNGLTSGTMYTFAVATNNANGSGDAASSNGVIPGWQALGGVLTTGPRISTSGASASDVFVRGTDNALWHRSWNGTAWSGWDSLGGVLVSEASAVSQSAGTTDVFVVGTDHGIWHRSWNGTVWSAWENSAGAGGYATSAPDVTSWGPGRLDLVVRGSTNALWHRSWNGSSWSGWANVGGVATSNPSVVASGTGRIDVFVRGTDNGLWHRTGTTAAGWAAWESVGGTLTSGVDAASCVAGHLDVFLLGTGGVLWQRGYNGSAWGGWQKLGGQWSLDPGAACEPATTTVDLVARAADLGMWHSAVTGS